MSSHASLQARADDTDDVRWALQTALAQLKQGGHADAIVWVKRAAEAAEAAGNPQRGAELRVQVRQLAEAMWSIGGAGAKTASSRPPISSSVEIEIDVELEELPMSSRRAPSGAPQGSSSSGRPPPLPLRPPPGARGFSDKPGAPTGGPPTTLAAPTVMGFAAPDIERTSLTEASPYRSSVPELEARELDADPLFTSGMPPAGASESQRPSAGRITGVGTAPHSVPVFNDRLSSVDIQPLSVDSVIPSFKSIPPTQGASASNPPAPESVRRALALIDDEEILQEDEDERVTQDFGILGPDAISPVHAKPSLAPTQPPPSGASPPSVAPIVVSDSQWPVESQRGAMLPPGGPPPGPVRSGPPPSGRGAPVSYPPPSMPPSAPGAGPASGRGVQHSAPPPSGRPSASIPPMLAPSIPPASVPPMLAPSVPPASIPPSPISAPPISSPPITMAPLSPAPPSKPSFAPPPEPFMRTPSSRPPEVQRLSRRAPPSPADTLGFDLGELTLEVSDLGPPAQQSSSRSGQLAAVGAELDAIAPVSAESESLTEDVGTSVDGIQLEELRGFEDLPAEVQRGLARSVRVQPLDAGDEVGFFGAAVVTAGCVDILPAISDDSGAVADVADVVFTKGSLPDSIALRVVAKLDGTRVATWDPDVFEAAIAPCPWLHDELRFIADYFVAVCGAALGPLGERLDPALRTAVFKRLEVRALQPGEVLLKEGAPIQGLFVVGGGRFVVERASGGEGDELLPGGFVFADKMMSAKPAPATVKAGAQGALVLYAPRAVAHELMMSVPPLLEVLAG